VLSFCWRRESGPIRKSLKTASWTQAGLLREPWDRATITELLKGYPGFDQPTLNLSYLPCARGETIEAESERIVFQHLGC
jgi:hypothetical protein